MVIGWSRRADMKERVLKWIRFGLGGLDETFRTTNPAHWLHDPAVGQTLYAVR